MTALSILRFIFNCLLVIGIFNLMIIVHELGHFLAGRWRGLVIEEFGVWFGKPLWRRKFNGVWYSLGSLPFGGFVKLPQMAPMDMIEGENDVPPEQLPSISALDKIIVAFAGPLFSFLLALAFAVLVWIAGRPVSEAETTTVIGYVAEGSPAATAGLQPGDKILSIDGHPVSRWAGMGRESVIWRIVSSEGEALDVEVKRADQVLHVSAKPQVPKTEVWERKGLRQLGMTAAETPLIGKLKKGSPAETAGLQQGDHILKANGQPVFHWLTLSKLVADHPGEPLRFTVQRGGQTFESGPIAPQAAVLSMVEKGSPAESAGLREGDRVTALNGQPFTAVTKFSELVKANGTQPLHLEVLRAEKPMQITLQPVLAETDKGQVPRIGVAWEEDWGIFDPRGVTTLDHPTPLAQVRKAGMAIVDTVKAIASRKSDVKLQHMGGPVMMMRAYYTFFQIEDGWRLAFWFSVVLNVNLAIMNMLPLPVLDGGHITLAIIESIRRRPAPVRVLEIIQTACAVVIIGFMLFIFFFDVQDLFNGGGRSKFRPAAANATPAPAVEKATPSPAP